MLPVFLINLDRSPDRLAAMRAQLHRLGVPFERIPAVDGRALSSEDAARNPPSRIHRPLRPGEMGCFGSHRRFWSLVCERGLTAAVVLEDDVLVDDDFVQALAEIEASLPRHGLVRLMTLVRKTTVPIEKIGRHRIEEPLAFSRCSGTQGYVITREAAARLVAESRVWRLPVDNFLDKSWVHGIPARQIHPPVLRCAVEFGSEIIAMSATEPAPKLPPSARALREFGRFLDWLGYAAWLARTLRPGPRARRSGDRRGAVSGPAGL